MALVHVTPLEPPPKPPDKTVITGENIRIVLENHRRRVEHQRRRWIDSQFDKAELEKYRAELAAYAETTLDAREAERQNNNKQHSKFSRNYEEDLSSFGSSSHKHCISINRIYDLLHRCGLWRSGHHVP